LKKYGLWRALDINKDESCDSFWWRDMKRTCWKRHERNWFNKSIKWKSRI